MTEWWHSVRLRLASWLRRGRLEQDLRDEFAFHLAMRAEQLRAEGAADAGDRARKRFGSVARIGEDVRQAWALAPRAGALLQDVRYAARVLRRTPVFAAVVVLTLGFGIAINTAAFSIVNAVLIRPLGFAEPERLMALHEELVGFGLEGAPFSPPDFIDVARDQQSFEGIAAYVNVPVELSGDGGDPVRLDAAKISANLFALLGVEPALGRGFSADEDRPGHDVAVLSWGLWHTRFAGDPAIVGGTITLDRRPYTIVGVMPAVFEFPRRGPAFNNDPAALWLPMAFTERQLQARGNEFNHSVVGRLKRGVSLAQARADLRVLASRINASYPPGLQTANFSINLSLTPLRDEIAGRIERPLLLLLAAVGLVLLVMCANVGNLVLSRAAARTREIAVRTALGSSRMRLLQLLLAEAALLSAVGTVLGILASRLVLGGVPTVVAETLPAARNVPIDLRVLAFTAGIAGATTIVFALIPLVTVDRSVAGSALRESASRTTPARRRHRVQAALVVSTVTLAVILLVGAGLFIRSFAALMATDPGFDPDRVLTASVTLPRTGYGTAASVRAFHRALLDRAAALPGAASAALMTDLPLERYERRTMAAEGVVLSGGPPSTNISWVDGPYFETLRIRLRSGRAFTEAETTKPRGVVVVNERLARTYWPGEDPVGKRLRWGLDVPQNPNPWLTVVGVVSDVADGPLGEQPYIHAYEPFSQFPDFVLNNIPTLFGRQIKLAVRAAADPQPLVEEVRAIVADLDRQLPIESIAMMDDRIADDTAPRRFSAMTLGAFGAGALGVAAIGLFGLLAFTVAERRREIAVRLALGAEPPAVVSMVMRQGLALVAIGLAVGVVASFGVARVVASLLYRTETHDLVTFAAVPALLLLVALAACALPAYRASRVEPLAALRAE